MHHIVMTRFNVRFSDDSQPPNEDWLRHRLEIFERYTAPSMAAQTALPDEWLLFCDEASPSWLTARLAQIGTVRLVRGPFTSMTASEAVGAPCASLITTRLDNDDAIARNFLEMVRRAADQPGYLNVIHGLQLAGDRLYLRSDPSNAFISRVEHRTSETVFSTPHDVIIERGRVHQIRATPSWLQIVHDQNLSNAAHGIRTTRKRLDRFSVDAYATDRGLQLDRLRSAVRLGARVARRPHRIIWAWRVLRRQVGRSSDGR